MKLTSSLLLIVLILTSCASTSFLNGYGPSTAVFTGMVYDKERQSVPSVKIQIFSPNANKASETQTDINGRFSLPEIPFGVLKVTLSKPLYEDSTMEFSFSSQTQVLYAQIVHRNSLVELCTAAYQSGEWDKARNYLQRAKVLDPSYPDTAVLEAFTLAHDGKYTEALDGLRAIVQRLPDLYTVYLIMADIYEFKVNDRSSAAEAMKQAINIRTTPEWEQRYQNLIK